MAKAEKERHVSEWIRDPLMALPYRKVVESQIIGDGKEGSVSLQLDYSIEVYDSTNDEHVMSWEKQTYGW